MKRTIGVEEEFCLVSKDGGEIRYCESVILRDAEKNFRERLRLETKRGMIEAVTEPLTGFGEICTALRRNRNRLARLAKQHGACIVSVGVHPWTEPQSLPLSEGSPRYERLAREQGLMTHNWMVCSTHYHVGTEDKQTAYVNLR